MIYAVDFDGTLCESKFPLIGKPNISLIEFLKTEKQQNLMKDWILKQKTLPTQKQIIAKTEKIIVKS